MWKPILRHAVALRTDPNTMRHHKIASQRRCKSHQGLSPSGLFSTDDVNLKFIV